MKKLISYKGKKAVFEDNTQLSEWYDDILVLSKNYCLLSRDNKVSIANTKDFNPIKWHSCIYPEGLLKNKSKYYIASDEDGLEAIYDSEGNQISFKWRRISAAGLVSSESIFFIASDTLGNEAIFDANNNQISPWSKKISEEGLVKGESKYFIQTIVDGNGESREIITHYSGEPISASEKHIYPFGLVSGKSNYYIARNDDLTAKLVHLEQGVIIERAVDIRPDGLVNGESKYFVVFDGEKDILCEIDGRHVKKLFSAESIWPDGLLKGESEYVIASFEDGEALYHKDELILSKKKAIQSVGLIKGKSKYVVVKELDNTWSIYDNEGNLIASKFEKIFNSGLINGKSNFVAAIRDGEPIIFHIDYPNRDLTAKAESRYGTIDSAEKLKSIVSNKVSVKFLTSKILESKDTEISFNHSVRRKKVKSK